MEIRLPAYMRHFPHGLIALWPSYLAYVITFMPIGQIWPTSRHVPPYPNCRPSRTVPEHSVADRHRIPSIPSSCPVPKRRRRTWRRAEGDAAGQQRLIRLTVDRAGLTPAGRVDTAIRPGVIGS
jgi:hypothetical protein